MKNLFYKLGAWISVASLSLFPVSAFAQLKPSTDADSDLLAIKTKLGDDTPTDLPELIGGLINVFLSVLGIIFIVLVVYSGYLWMTAGGEAMKVDKAKKLLGQAVIGLIIVVAAYAITAFVIDRIVGATV
jgi:amino acid transporter